MRLIDRHRIPVSLGSISLALLLLGLVGYAIDRPAGIRAEAPSYGPPVGPSGAPSPRPVAHPPSPPAAPSSERAEPPQPGSAAEPLWPRADSSAVAAAPPPPYQPALLGVPSESDVLPLLERELEADSLRHLRIARIAVLRVDGIGDRTAVRVQTTYRCVAATQRGRCRTGRPKQFEVVRRAEMDLTDNGWAGALTGSPGYP